jgi:hypothetical protein
MNGPDPDLRDCCTWRGCGHPSDLIYYGVGLCDEHWTQACAVFKPTHEYVLQRVTREAADIIKTRTKD